MLSQMLQLIMNKENKNKNTEGGMKRTATQILGQAATTGKVETSIGTITMWENTQRVTWKLDGKQIDFNTLYDKLESREG